MTKPHNDFDVGKSIHDLLEPLNDERRQRILRWVSESLGLVTVVNTASANPPSNPSAGIPQPPANTSSTATSQTTDIKSFVESKLPKSDVQFAAVVAYYYRFEAPDDKKTDTITPDVLQNATRLAGRNRLGNARSTLNNAKKLGYLDSPTTGEFELNTVGENLVAMTLPGGSSETKGTKNTKKKRTKRAAKKKTVKKTGSKKSK